MPAPISSQTHAILLPRYRTCVQRGAFERLSQQHQINELRAAIEADHPQLASAMKVWSPTTQSAVLAQLARASTERPPLLTTELWRVRRDDRELVAQTVQTVTGTELQLIEDQTFLTRRLFGSMLQRIWALPVPTG